MFTVEGKYPWNWAGISIFICSLLRWGSFRLWWRWIKYYWHICLRGAACATARSHRGANLLEENRTEQVVGPVWCMLVPSCICPLLIFPFSPRVVHTWRTYLSYVRACLCKYIVELADGTCKKKRNSKGFLQQRQKERSGLVAAATKATAPVLGIRGLMEVLRVSGVYTVE